MLTSLSSARNSFTFSTDILNPSHGVDIRFSSSRLQSLDLLSKWELSFNSKQSMCILFSRSSVPSTVTLNTDTPVYEESQLTLRPDLLGNLQPNSEQKYRSISRINPLWLTTKTFAGSFPTHCMSSTSQLCRLLLSYWSSSSQFCACSLCCKIISHNSKKKSSALCRISSNVSSLLSNEVFIFLRLSSSLLMWPRNLYKWKGNLKYINI